MLPDGDRLSVEMDEELLPVEQPSANGSGATKRPELVQIGTGEASDSD